MRMCLTGGKQAAAMPQPQTSAESETQRHKVHLGPVSSDHPAILRSSPLRSV